MILHGIEIQNFKAFRGTHVVEFEAPTKTRNVYLVGGMNGSGKTSIVHAIVLVMLGRAAAGLPGMFQSGRERRRNYEDWLKASFNYDAARSGDDLMSVAVRITDDQRRLWTVRRSWWFDGMRRVDEEMIEIVPLGPGAEGEASSGEEAEAAIARIFPRNLGELLFFDGEDIRLVAPDGKTVQVESVLDRLLGLDPIKKLVSDIDRLIQDRRADLASPQQLQAMESIQRNVKSAARDLDQKRKDLAGTEAECADIQAEIIRLEDATAAALDSDLPLTASQVRTQLSDLMRRRADVRHQIGRYLADWLYLFPALESLDADLVAIEDSIGNRSAADAEKLQAEAVFAFAERLRHRLSANADIPSVVESAIEALLKAEAGRMTDQAKPDRFEEFSLNELQMAQAAAARLLSRDMTDAANLSRSLQEIDESIDRLEALRNQFATSSELERLIKRRDELQELAGGLAVRKEHEELACEEAANALTREKMLLQKLSSSFSGDSASRSWIVLADNLKQSVLAYVGMARSRALGEMEGNLLIALQRLYRKSHHVASVSIDPSTYEVRARDRRGEHLSMPSAGEQQLLALGLAHAMLGASAQPLPFFIDTPLGRLDSEHRLSVVEGYLPGVAKQVFVFSTDEEIVGNLHERLTQRIRGRFLIEHDDETGNSRILNNHYFEDSYA